MNFSAAVVFFVTLAFTICGLRADVTIEIDLESASRLTVDWDDEDDQTEVMLAWRTQPQFPALGGSAGELSLRFRAPEGQRLLIKEGNLRVFFEWDPLNASWLDGDALFRFENSELELRFEGLDGKAPQVNQGQVQIGATRVPSSNGELAFAYFNFETFRTECPISFTAFSVVVPLGEIAAGFPTAGPLEARDPPRGYFEIRTTFPGDLRGTSKATTAFQFVPDSHIVSRSIDPISSFSFTPAGLRFTIPTHACRAIGIEYSRTMAPGSWIELGNFFEEQEGVSVFFDPDLVRRGRPSGFYRAFLRPR